MLMDIEKVFKGRMFVDGELRYTEVGVTDGKIVAVGNLVRGGDEVVELGTSQMLLPAFTDPHVHLRDPGMTSKEDFYTGTLAAIHAGVTCVLDMPNTKPPVTDVHTLMEKKSAVRGKACVDYGLFAAVTPNINAGMLAPLVPGFKLFMGSTTGNILLNDDEELIPAVRDVLATGKRMSVHAEDDSMILHEPERSTRDHLRNRPAEAELNAVSRLSKHFSGTKINICHVSSVPALEAAAEAGFTTESTLHHIMFDVDRFPSSYYKTNPPIRDSLTRKELYKKFIGGAFTMIGTDHAPHTAEDKEQEFDAAPGGIPGVETTMPIVMEMVRNGTVPLQTVMSMASLNPNKAFGISKGKIAPGYDADFAIFDMRRTSVIDVKKLHSKCGHSPYSGWQAVFPETVLVRGETQISDGEFCGETMGVDICG